jgi:hypothetical protein
MVPPVVYSGKSDSFNITKSTNSPRRVKTFHPQNLDDSDSRFRANEILCMPAAAVGTRGPEGGSLY